MKHQIGSLTKFMLLCCSLELKENVEILMVCLKSAVLQSNTVGGGLGYKLHNYMYLITSIQMVLV